MDSEQRTALRNRLEKIRLRNKGLLTPDDVVADAKSEASPLHPFFTWDDSVAAHQFRLDQARTLIRNVTVEISTSTQRIMAPFYIRDPRLASDEQGYGSVVEFKDDREVAADALRYEFDRAIGSLERAVTVAAALGLSGQVQEMLNQAKIFRESVDSAKGSVSAKPLRREKDNSRKIPAKSVARRT